MTDTFTKTELVDTVAAATRGLPITRRDIAVVVEEALYQAARAVRAGRKVRLQHLGSLERRPTPARTARNPKTGEPVAVPAGHRVRFRAAADLDQPE